MTSDVEALLTQNEKKCLLMLLYYNCILYFLRRGVYPTNITILDRHNRKVEKHCYTIYYHTSTMHQLYKINIIL